MKNLFAIFFIALGFSENCYLLPNPLERKTCQENARAEQKTKSEKSPILSSQLKKANSKWSLIRTGK